MRCGVLLHAKEGGVKITNIDAPELDPRFMLLTGSDMPGDNTLTLFSNTRPIITDSIISYPRQAVAALFAPDYESALLMADEIKIETEPLEEEPQQSLPYPLEYMWGDFNPEEDEEAGKYRKVETEFTLGHKAQPERRLYTVTAWIDGASLHIEAPTEWIELVRSTVQKVTGYPKRNIIIHTIPYTSKNGEFLIDPAALAAIAATSALRTGLPSEIREETMNAHPGIVVKRETWIDEEGKPVSEKATMTVNQGAFLVIPEEYQRQAMAGLIPPYSLKSFHGSVAIETSNEYPAAFTTSFGFSEALAATEYHISRLAEKTELTPYLFRDSIEKDKRKFTDYLPSFDLTDQKRTAKAVAIKSSYNRKWAANTFQHKSFGFLGYIKGIGFASGTGIAGFSTTFSKSSGFAGAITYTQKHSVVVSTSADNHPGTMKRWKKNISDRLAPGNPDKVTFTPIFNNETIDTGPDVLSRIVASFSSQLENASKKLAVLKDEEQLPVSIRFDAENTSFPCEFESSGCGAVALEVMIRQCDMKPVVTAIWASFSFPAILDEISLKNSLKRTLMTTVHEFGGVIEDDFSLYLEISASGSGTLSSPQELARGLAIGALADALMQAGGKTAASMPISSTKIEEIFHE